MGATAYAGNTTIILREPVDWPVGATIGITSSSWNWRQRETVTILAVNSAGLTPAMAALSTDLYSAVAAGAGPAVNCSNSYSATYDSTGTYTFCAVNTTCTSCDLSGSGCCVTQVTNTNMYTFNTSDPTQSCAASNSSSAGTTTYPAGTVLTISTPLAYTHLCSPTVVNGVFVDVCPEVALLTSNVVIQAADGPTQYTGAATANTLLTYGGAVQAGFYTPGYGTGSLKMQNVQFAYMGQYGQEPALAFSYMYLAGFGSYVRNSTFTNTMYSGIELTSSQGVEISGNVVWESMDYHAVRIGGTRNYLLNNLAHGTARYNANKNNFDFLYQANFLIQAGGNVVQGNVAAGSDRLGFDMVGDPCRYEQYYGATNASLLYNGQPLIYNNTAHSALIGLMLRSTDQLVGQVDMTLPTWAVNGGVQARTCTQVKGFSAWRNWDFGILASVRGLSTDALFTNVAFAENRHSSLTPLLVSSDLSANTSLYIQNAVFIGQTNPSVCSECTTGKEIGCHANPSTMSFPATGLSRGFETLTAAVGFSEGPEFEPWAAAMGYALTLGRGLITNVTFANWSGKDACGVSNAAFVNKDDEPDISWPHYFSGISLSNVATSAGGLVRLSTPSTGLRNPVRCGTLQYAASSGQILSINCAGLSRTLFYDVDGSLGRAAGLTSGAPVALLGEILASRGQYGQYPLLPSKYSFTTFGGQEIQVLQGYTNEPAVLLRQTPIATDPEYFVIESRDTDTETRNVSPVLLQDAASGTYDVLAAMCDFGWCFSYTCSKRLSTFSSIVYPGGTYLIQFAVRAV